MVEQLIRRDFAALDAFLERVEEMRLIGDKPPGPDTSPRLEARL